MVASLPGNIRLKLAQTLAQWRQWHCEPTLAAAPEVTGLLTSGLTHSLNRQGEWHSLVAANQAGLAPTPRYFNPELGSLVCDYLEPDKPQPMLIPDMAQLLRNIHTLPPRHHRLDLAERILGYEKRLAQINPARAEQLAQPGKAVATALAACNSGAHSAVLCHHDLLRANRLYSGGRLFALDWEYSAMGDAWYDLAVVAAGDELADNDVGLLLQAYLGRSATGAERQRLAHYMRVYRYLEILWYLAQDHARFEGAQLEQKLERLVDALGRD
jgi:thiamine kinase-like enzyme